MGIGKVLAESMFNNGWINDITALHTLQGPAPHVPGVVEKVKETFSNEKAAASWAGTCF